MNILRTILFSIVAFISVLVYGMFLLPSLFSSKIARLVSYVWICVIMFATRYIAGIKVCVYNKEIAEKKGVIIACNHCSAWETFFIAYYFKIPTFILKKDLFLIPILGQFLKTLDMVGVNRESYSKKYRRAIIVKVGRVLKKGFNVAIFPQGTRVPTEQTFNYKLYPYKPGITIFARGNSILTCSTDARKTFGRSLFSLKSAGTVNFIFNEVLYIENDATKEEILQRVQDSIASGCKKFIKI